MTVKTGVVYLQKDKFQLYSPLSGRVFEFRFVPEIIRDLDVINKEVLENYIKVFVTNSKLAPCNLLFVLADNAYFVKDFVLPAAPKAPAPAQPSVTMEVLQKLADEFIEHVPFDNVVSKTLPLKNGMKIIATNQDFYESIAVSFEHLGFTVESVLPGLVLGNGISLRPVLDPATAGVMLQKASAAKQYDLLGQQVYQPSMKQESEEVDEVEISRMQETGKKPDKNKILMLVGVGVILLILIVVLYQQLTAPPPDWRKNAANNAPAAASSTNQVNTAPAAQTAVPAASASAESASNITVQIVSSNSSASTAQSLLARLDTYKFKSVTSQNQQSVGSAATLVSFSTATSQDVRTTILTEVKKFENNVIVQEKQIGAFDVTIVLGQ